MTSTPSEAAAIPQTEEEWREKLTPMQYQVAREAGTERAFSGEFWNTKETGTYMWIGWGGPLFRSEANFDSGSGLPSFYEAVDG
ncbi:MAG: peptide-methionine (R)-S-oxide reductase, partial [Acidimicrobiia bacterium]|nr:peptide-methionine (R)-S-oxide reductase [Acidimicrobiia bacterium]